MKRIVLTLVFLAGCMDLAPWQKSLSKSFSERDVKEKVGILAHLEITWPNSTGPLRRALAHFRSEKVNRVVIVGDPTKNGNAHQKKVFQEAWDKAFAGMVAPELVLSKDPYRLNGIAFTCAGRYPLTDLLCIHPADGHQIVVGSMRGFDLFPIFKQPSSKLVSASKNAAQGLLVLIRESRMDVLRLDFSGKTAREVGNPWTIGSDGLIQSEGEKTPEFWPDTRLQVVRGYNEKGSVVYTVRWPSVLAQHTGARAYSYDVTVGNRVIRRLQSDAFYLPESSDVAAISCRIPESELNGEEPRFGVTPISSLGHRGRTVWSSE